MQHRNNMILYNVLNQEVVFEEYFCNLLQFDDFRDLFISFINQQSKSSFFHKKDIQYKNFNTEIALENEKYGRADLFLKYANQEYIFEIKNKDRTNLTPNQPIGYLKYLQNQNLFFLIPRNYIHKKVIIERWETYNLDNTHIAYDIESKILYWQDFIILLQKESLLLEKIEIKLFYEFCVYWFNMQTILFKEEELNLIFLETLGENKMSNIANIMKKLSMTVNGVIDLGIEIDKKYDEQNAEYFGYIINNNKYKIDKDLDIWFGISYDIWESNSNAPLILELCTEDVNMTKKIKQLTNIKEFKYKDGYCYYYALEFQENIDMKNHFYDFIQTHLNILKGL